MRNEREKGRNNGVGGSGRWECKRKKEEKGLRGEIKRKFGDEKGQRKSCNEWRVNTRETTDKELKLKRKISD